jgi:hemoglobin
MSSRRAANFDGDQSMNTKSVPTLYEWAGGMASPERLTNHFDERVRQDEMLSPVFAQMQGEHPRFVAQFLAEVLGGPAVYSAERGGHAHMISRHLDRRLTEAQRKRWMTMLLESADAVGLPDDPEFRSVTSNGVHAWLGSTLSRVKRSSRVS